MATSEEIRCERVPLESRSRERCRRFAAAKSPTPHTARASSRCAFRSFREETAERNMFSTAGMALPSTAWGTEKPALFAFPRATSTAALVRWVDDPPAQPQPPSRFCVIESSPMRPAILARICSSFWAGTSIPERDAIDKTSMAPANRAAREARSRPG